MERIRLLWIDETRSVRHSELPETIARACDVHVCRTIGDIDDILLHNHIDAVCFDLDFPDRAALNRLRDVKQQYPYLPLIMVTVQHSETLAVWALRSRVFDYFVKPVPRLEFARCIKRLEEVRDRKRSKRTRELIGTFPAVPIDTPVASRNHESELTPALAYVEQNFRYKVQLNAVAKLCSMSPFRFSRAFKDAFSITFQEYVIRYRILESVRLFQNPDANVTDVAYAIGFNDASYFSKMFRRYFKMAPRDYITQNQDERANVTRLTAPGQVLALPRAREYTNIRKKQR